METTVDPLLDALDRADNPPAVRVAIVNALLELDARKAAPNLFGKVQEGNTDLRDLIEPALARWNHAPMRAVWLARLAGFLGFEAGILPREALFLFPNLFEFWFLAVACTLRYAPGFRWTGRRTTAALGVLFAGKLVQEWALHVGRLFDAMTFLGAIEAIRDAISSAVSGRGPGGPPP